MYQRRFWYAALCIFALAAVGGCKKAEIVSVEKEQAKAAIDEWRQLAQNPDVNIGNQRAAELGNELAAGGPESLDPVLKALESPDSTPALKVLATITLEPVTQMDEDGSLAINRVKPLLDASQDATTRACAAQILSAALRQDLRPLLETAASDSDNRVKIAALGGLAALGDPNAVNQLKSLYRDPKVKLFERDRVAYALCQVPPDMLDMEILTDALYKVPWDSTRLAIIKTLGQFGTPAQIHPLEDFSKGVVVGANVVNAASEAVAAIRERNSTGEAAAPGSESPAAPAAPAAPESTSAPDIQPPAE